MNSPRSEQLPFSPGDLSREIVQSIRTGANKRFLTFIDNTTVQELSFADFGSQLEQASSFIERNWKTNHSFYILSQNSVQMLVWIVSLVLNSKSICILNPTDTDSETKEKLPKDHRAILLTEKKFSEVQVQQYDISVPEIQSPKKLEEVLSNISYQDEQFISVYTSGSTSAGKKVLQTEKGALFNIKDLIQFHRLTSYDIILTSMPVFHVNALYFSFFCSLLNSSEIVLLKGFSYQSYFTALRTRQVTIISAFPELIRILLLKSTELKELLPQTFKYIVSAASYLPKELFLNWNSQMPGRLIQGYGLSEAINFSILMDPFTNPEQYLDMMTSHQTPCIGKALPGNEVNILRDDLTSCAPHEVGQIFISGTYLMKAYEGLDPRTTFIQGKLATGDLGYYIEDMNKEKYFFIIGRIKDILKINGESVSFSSIEQSYGELRKQCIDFIAVQLFDQNGFEKLGLVIQVELAENQSENILKNSKSKFHPAFLFFTTLQLRTASGKPKRGYFSKISQNKLKGNNYEFLNII